MKRISVILAEDHTIVREGLRALLQMESDIEVVGEAENGRQAVALARKLLPDVVVMDIAMPLLNGMEAARRICRIIPQVRVLVLSAHADEAYVRRVLEVGAAGYLLKQTAAQVLADAIRAVCRNEQFFSPVISQRHLRAEREAKARGTASRASAGLTTRETEVLQMVAEGKANKETAVELGISIKTVEKHRQKAMAKLGIHDTATLTRYAIAAGIIESSVQVTVLTQSRDL